MLVLGSVWTVVTWVAGAALLLAIARGLVRAFRERGTPASREVGLLERAQEAAVLVAAVGIIVGTLLDVDAAADVGAVGFLVALALAVVRWRRQEPPLPRWVL